jgi:hypothetical protein
MGVERIYLDENSLQIQFSEQLLKQSPLVIAGGGVTGLTDHNDQSGRIKHDLVYKCRTCTVCGCAKFLRV